MLIISFDSVGDTEFDHLAQYSAVASLIKDSAVFRDVSGVFVSNTYPIHTSVVTGVGPGLHGVRANTQPFPARYATWNSREDNIRVKTLWQAAAEKGIKTAAVFWPVTAYSKTINYNVPEVIAKPGESQLLTSLKAGSKRLQLKLFFRHRKLLNGINQPNLDNFAAACMADILRKYNPGLALIHLTAYDSLCHKNGKNSAAIKEAFKALDENLALLLDLAGSRDIIVFSDHSQINVHTVIEPNSEFAEIGEGGCFIECCGGSAFFHAGKLEARRIEELRDKIAQSRWFRRFLTEEEMNESGYQDTAFGFCAKEGFCFDTHASSYKGNHGYPLDMPDYKVFFMVKGKGFNPGAVTHGGSLLDIAPITAKLLGVNL